ncbi:MAG TPA: hypothetical protein VL358_03240 [Caulobacteraceae bacterium]|jgi:hypothetical protein|nr:hypothetical protein [Caulobacteraceae bacterium]
MKRENKAREAVQTTRRKKLVLIGLGAVASAILALLWIAAE